MKAHYLIGILVLSLFLFGCNQNNKGASLGTPFIGGTEGIKMHFRENAPPDQIFDSGEMPFDISVLLKNEGEFTVPAGEARLTLQGIDATAFGKSPSDMVVVVKEPLQAKEKSTMGKEIDSPEVDVSIENLNYKNKLAGDFSMPIKANLCYLYQTEAVVGLCLSSNPLAQNTGVCNVQEAKTVYNSGAPVQIENFVEYVRGKNKIGFSFDIVQKGNGEIIKDTEQNCLDASVPEQNEMFVSVDTGLPGLKCRPLKGGTDSSGYARLSNGKVTVDCEQSVSQQGSFVKPISIKLKYRYSQTISKEVVIKKAAD